MKLTLVEWEDTVSGNSWESCGEKEHTQRVTSVGILVREDSKEIELVPNLTISHKLHQIAIPKGCIKRMRRLHI